MQHAQAALVLIASGDVGERHATCICCCQTGCRVAAQPV
jgi:hypothetical protein